MMRYLPEVSESAVDKALAEWQARHPAMGVCVLLPEAEKERVALLQRACANRGVPLVGAIFPALVRDDAFATAGVWLLCFEHMPYVALYENLPSDAGGVERVTDEIADGLRSHLDDTPDITLFLLFDAMVPNIATVLDGLYLQLANRVHYAGVNAGSETFQPMPCLFDGSRLVQNGLLVMLLKPHHGAVLEHGYHAPGKSVYATSSQGNRISQIDWRPAFEVYREMVQSQYGVEITRENFYQHAVHFPFGIVRANHHVVVRIPVMLGDDGSLFCVGEIPPNAVLTLLQSPTVDSDETMRVLLDGIHAFDGSADELLLFYCAGRRMHMGLEAATSELHVFSGCSGASRVAGALSLGEIGSSTNQGYPLFHNATLVAARWQ